MASRKAQTMSTPHTDKFLATLRALPGMGAQRLWLNEPSYRPFLALAGWVWTDADTFTLQPNKET